MFGRSVITLPLAMLLLGCLPGSSDIADDTADEPVGTEPVPALGGLTHDPASLEITTIATKDDGLDVPRDLEFNPEVPGELWVVNQGDDGVVIINDPGTDDQASEHIVDPYALHFMEEVSSISFGAPGTFGTCQESRNRYNDTARPNDFMGPALWSSDRDVFGKTNPDAVDFVGADLGSHLDMQHETPLCVGIAWETDNVYWSFDGQEGSIDRVDFGADHGPGYDDHSDGITATYVSGELERVRDVPGHLVYDHETGLLYIADTGNGRIAVLDTLSGTRGEDRPIMELGTEHYYMDDAELWTLVAGLDEPSGLDMHDGVLYVTEHGIGRVSAYDLGGTLLDWVDLDVKGVMGVEVVAPDDIYVVDGEKDLVLRLQPAE